MSKLHPSKLSSCDNNLVIAIDDTEVGKLFISDSRSDIGSEAEKMKFANNINDLVVKFKRLEYNDVMQGDMLIMERLYPMDYRAYELSKREIWLDVFFDEVHELHRNGFVHRDMLRPSNIPGGVFDNVFLTEKGLRLIDVGISTLAHQVNVKMFEIFVQKENEELQVFAEHFLSR
ncbi:MAG: hypothetical protein IPN72_12465 [Saprospiraceae bacterium]|nr:hypothetical protein [Saprospiraceae bacterium]